MKKWVTRLGSAAANSAAFEKFLGLLEQTDGETGNLFRVLTYHRVDEPGAYPWLDPGLLSASPEVFEAQVKYLSKNYEIVSLDNVIQVYNSEGQNPLPARAVMITFDDGYSDFEKYAWPTLKQYRAPATLFVPTAFPDHPERLFWWDCLFHALNTTKKKKLSTPTGQFVIDTPLLRKQVYKQLRGRIKTLPNKDALKEVDQICHELEVLSKTNCVLGWESLRKLSDEGLALGAHTRTHPIMNHISLAELNDEIIGSIQDLQREIGSASQSFAYPSGMHNDQVVHAIKQAGVRLAFTTIRGINKAGQDDPLRLRRINIGARTTIPILRAQLLSRTANFYASLENL